MNDMDQVYRQHAQTVYKFLLSQCHDADLAEELTQETFYQAVKSIGRFDGSCKLSTWLCQIARHLWYQHLEKHRAERTMTRPLAETPPEDDPAVPLRRGGDGVPAGSSGPAAADPRPAGPHAGGGVSPGLRRSQLP